MTSNKPTIGDLRKATDQAVQILMTEKQCKILGDELNELLERVLDGARDKEERENIRNAIHKYCYNYEVKRENKEITLSAKWVIENFQE